MLLTCKSSPPKGALLEESVLRISCEFLGASLYVGVILIKLQNGFAEITLLHCCSPVGLVHVCRASFLENTSGGLLLKNDNFIHDF